ncbi:MULTISPECIES: hypothetical protein [unclassified Halomonas]|uniref:hypothetical protein n=1 Tax=unclassified Halomonas TaxID=2609666 RepID=UPI0009EF53E2|nr:MULTISPECIES: hypothetical protein [unclassified Halomonas]MBT2788076.1 DNA-binding protein [Halomonas sp. ISL-106]MBT2795825.1 DNA-binding protein [Halomonas sp. ISL-104]
MSELRKAIDIIGGPANCARICGISSRGVYKWLQRGSLPRTEYTGETQHAQKMAAAANGAFTTEWLLEQAGPSQDESKVNSYKTRIASS